MHSYIITGIRMGPFVRLLRKHGFTSTLKNTGRLLYILQNCLWSSFFAWRQRNVYRHKWQSWPVPEDPVIIIGHWRTGSTFLHNLLSCDPQFIAPSLFQVTFPEGFLVSERYFRPIMTRMLKQRPMDNMKLGFDSPQEDEFALFKLTLDSPYEAFIFPDKQGYFFNKKEDFLPSEENKENWKKQFRDYCRKLDLGTGRKVLLKNPMHSMRIALLLETFPKARFIHIHRHPYSVVPSTMHLWKVMADGNRLKGKPYHPSMEEVTAGLDLFYSVIQKDKELVKKGQFCEVAYEDLENDPMGTIGKIYSELGLDLTEEAERGIRVSLEQSRGFKKNSYTFGNDGKKVVQERLTGHFKHYHYSD